jgi:hypothetical protein
VLLNKLFTFALNDNLGPGAELPDCGDMTAGPPGPPTIIGGAPGSGPAAPPGPLRGLSVLFNTKVFVKLMFRL